MMTEEGPAPPKHTSVVMDANVLVEANMGLWAKSRGSLRLGDGLDAANASYDAGPDDVRPPGAPQPSYVEGLVKLFPVEGVTLLPMVGPIADTNEIVRFVLIGVIVVLIVALRWHATKPKEGGDADLTAIIVSVVSFLLYAATLQSFGLILEPESRHTLLFAFITTVWVALVPLLGRKN